MGENSECRERTWSRVWQSCRGCEQCRDQLKLEYSFVFVFVLRPLLEMVLKRKRTQKNIRALTDPCTAHSRDKTTRRDSTSVLGILNFPNGIPSPSSAVSKLILAERKCREEGVQGVAALW